MRGRTCAAVGAAVPSRVENEVDTTSLPSVSVVVVKNVKVVVAVKYSININVNRIVDNQLINEN